MGRKKGTLLSEKDFKAFKTKRGKQLIGVLLLLMFLCGFISIIANSGNGVDYTNTIILLIVLGVIGFYFIISTYPFFKEWVGEKRVGIRLKRLARRFDGFVINDVTIPDDETGRTSQIDHILFSRYGIFVVETKNYSGYIYGDDNQSQWTQVLSYGRIKKSFYNPVKQNAVHCFRLSAIIDNEKLKLASVVIFIKENGGNIQSSNVYNLADLRYLISKKSTQLYDDEDVQKAYDAILYYKENKIVSKKEHIQSILDNKEKIKNSICPRCGGQLVVRTSKNGNQFYGCENYPECTFTQKI